PRPGPRSGGPREDATADLPALALPTRARTRPYARDRRSDPGPVRRDAAGVVSGHGTRRADAAHRDGDPAHRRGARCSAYRARGKLGRRVRGAPGGLVAP